MLLDAYCVLGPMNLTLIIQFQLAQFQRRGAKCAYASLVYIPVVREHLGGVEPGFVSGWFTT